MHVTAKLTFVSSAVVSPEGTALSLSLSKTRRLGETWLDGQTFIYIYIRTSVSVERMFSTVSETVLFVLLTGFLN
jgi:hypothetical protein